MSTSAAGMGRPRAATVVTGAGSASRLHVVSSLDVISPELVLISPELAEAARADLSPMPWDAPTRNQRLSRRPTRERPSDASLHVIEGDSLFAPLSHQALRSLLRTPRAERPSGSSRRAFVAAAGAVAVLVAAVLVLGFPGAEGWATRDSPEVMTEQAPTSQAVVGATPLSPLVASAGYVVEPRGSFMTDASGRTIEVFTLPLRCGGSRPLVVRDVPVSTPATKVVTKAVGRPVTVRITATILEQESVRGTVFASGRACAAEQVSFVAHLS